MNTAVTIPWEAVVEGCPPSQAKALPLVVSHHCSSRSDFASDDHGWLTQIERMSSDALAVAWRSSQSTRVELLLIGGEAEAVATLTSDGETNVILQSLATPMGTTDIFDAHLATDELVRTYVLRYARLDADVKAFVPPEAGEVDGMPTHFVRPANWGFGRPPATGTKGTSWQGSGLPPKDEPHLVNCYCSTASVLLSPHRSPFDEPTPDRGDPLHCLEPLTYVRAVLESGLCAEMYEPHAESMCYRTVLTLGRCRLFGVRVADGHDFTPGPVVFSHASRLLIEYLLGVQRFVAVLERSLDRQGAYAHRNIALELLEARTDAHAAYLALDEAYAAALYDGSPEVPAMSRRLTQVRRLINLFDGNLRKNLPLLRLAASTYLLDNWRRLLAPTYRDCPPWWLDGCIG